MLLKEKVDTYIKIIQSAFSIANEVKLRMLGAHSTPVTVNQSTWVGIYPTSSDHKSAIIKKTEGFFHIETK